VTTLREHVGARSNDYAALEVQYLAAVGTPLILDGLWPDHRAAHPVTKSLSVLIGAFDCGASLAKTLLSIERSSFNARHGDQLEVIVVDDGSTDGTRQVVCDRTWQLNLTYVRQEHAGLTVAHNTGLAFATRDIVLFSDADLVHMPWALEELMKRHELLEDLTLVGFRFEVDANDPRIADDAIRAGLPEMVPAFYQDFRLHFPGSPENMCAATDDLKTFGFSRTLRMANGASYDLPAMVVGAFFSLSREAYSRMGGSDERLTGWGCEDSLIGARSVALGHYVVPVYAAAAGHISHPRRTPNEPQEFGANIATANRILDEPFEADAAVPLERYRARAREVVERRLTGGGGWGGPEKGSVPIAHVARVWDALGFYEEALASYDACVRAYPRDPWALLGRARALRELGRLDESRAACADAAYLDPANPWIALERALAHATGREYAAARADLENARRLAPHEFTPAWMLDTGSTTHKARGNHHAAQGFHRAAVRDFDLALIVDAENCWAHYDRAHSLNALDRPAEALASLRRADALLHPLDRNRTWLHNQLGVTCMALGLVNEAKVQLETALALLPANADAAKNLDRLHVRGEREHGLLCHVPAIRAARDIEGWLTDVEADLLVAATRRAAALACAVPEAAIVEVGTYCGKSTVVIGSALDALDAGVTLHAIDPHQNYHYGRFADTFDIAVANVARHGFEKRVRVTRARSTEVEWSAPIVLLFIDGLHDYASVLADFQHFAPHVVPGGFVAFHDYFEHCPGVMQCVDDLLRANACTFVTHRERLVICRLPG
jgi:tetratricopeptide (TPR) repeat protein/GT2 family glycosyltransferase